MLGGSKARWKEKPLLNVQYYKDTCEVMNRRLRIYEGHIFEL